MRTFCWLDTKWLCQNSVIRSVSGEGVASISCTHHARKLEPCADLLLLEGLALLVGVRRRRAGSRSGAGVEREGGRRRDGCRARRRAADASTASLARQRGVRRGLRRRSDRSRCAPAGGARRRSPSARRPRRQRSGCAAPQAASSDRHAQASDARTGRMPRRRHVAVLSSTRKCARLLTAALLRRVTNCCCATACSVPRAISMTRPETRIRRSASPRGRGGMGGRPLRPGRRELLRQRRAGREQPAAEVGARRARCPGPR